MRGPPRWQFKICLIGDGNVGKTSIRRTYLKEGFKKSYIPTLGVDFAQKSFEYEGMPTNLVIWDIAGQAAYQSLRKRYYEGCSGMIFVYSVVDRVSFDNASKWLVEAHGFMDELPPLIIVANKIDLRPQHLLEETVTPEEGQAFKEKFSEELNTPSIFIETSALTGENIEQVFNLLTGMMIEKNKDRVISLVKGIPAIPSTEASQPATSEIGSVASSEEQIASVIENIAVPGQSDIDPITSLASDSAYLDEEQIGKAMTELNKLRTDLHKQEEELSKVMSELETKLVNLRNIVHVKKIMHEHLKQQLHVTRQEWAEAYEEYGRISEQKKDELEKRTFQIEDLRKRIDELGKTIRQLVSTLDFKKISE